VRLDHTLSKFLGQGAADWGSDQLGKKIWSLPQRVHLILSGSQLKIEAQTGTFLKNSRSRSRARHRPTKKRSPPRILADEHSEEVGNPPQADY